MAMLAAAAAASNSASGSIVEFVGLADDAGASGPAMFGTDGYDLYSTRPVGLFSQEHDVADPFGAGIRIQSLPNYIASVTANGVNHSAAGYNYATINNPATGTPVQAGFTFRFDSINTEKSLLDINLGSNVPSVFYVGIMTDTGIAPGGDSFEAVRLLAASGGDSGLITAMGDVDSGVDFYFFKVAGANPGDTLTISGVEENQHSSSQMYHLAVPGLTFSQTNPAVPEPASFVIWSLFGFIGGFVAWRKRKQ
jgi:hypothetical protein